MLYLLTEPNLIVCLALLLEILGNIYIVSICLLVCDVISFKFLKFKNSYQAASLHDQKNRGKTKIS